ncbi:MAG: response regulator [Thainema sp.]
MQTGGTKRFILVLDHNPEHVDTIQRSLCSSGKPYHLETIGDGDRALDFLHRRDPYSEAAHPDLILLDLNLPGRNGREILADIKTDSSLKRIPTIVFTVSDSDADILYSYTHQGNCYVVKSSDLEQLSQIVKRIEDFWLEIVTLPVE